jgi:hypothetical protein
MIRVTDNAAPSKMLKQDLPVINGLNFRKKKSNPSKQLANIL